MDTLNIEDPVALCRYLRRTGRIGHDEQPGVEILAGGVSNRTVLVERAAPCGRSLVLKQALPRLRVDVEWYCEPERIAVEARALRWLAHNLPAGSVPEFVFLDADQHLLAMTAVGRPHENWKARLLAGRLEADAVEQFAGLLVVLHRASRAQQDALAVEFADPSYFEKLRLEPYYAYAASRVPEAAGFLTELIGQTRARRATLVHGDFSPKNILIHAGRLVLLDHEVMHWGDPAFDVGFSLAHLLSKAHYLPDLRDAFAGAAQSYWRSYRRGIGEGDWQQELELPAVRHTLGCLLARVAGRSPLEYLNDGQRQRQQQVVCELMRRGPDRIEELVAEFSGRI